MKTSYIYKSCLLFLFLFLCFAHRIFAGELYEKEFKSIYDYLLKDDWDESGNWKGDMMGDANWFATVLLFQIGEEKKDDVLAKKAAKSAEWEQVIFQDYKQLFKTGKMPGNVAETIGGLPGLFYGYKFTKRDDFKSSMEEAMDLAYSLAKNPSSESLLAKMGLDYVVMLAATAYSCSQIYLETKDEKYKERALSLIETADVAFWDEDEKYYGTLWDWAQGSMLLALSGAYEITKDEKYFSRAKELLQTMLDKLWDKEKGGLKTRTHFELTDAKVLSGNNLFTTALIEWHRLTKETVFLDYAKKTLDFVVSPVLFDGKIIYHHFDKNGRAKYHCTGCMFHTLLNIYQLNKARRQ